MVARGRQSVEDIMRSNSDTVRTVECEANRSGGPLPLAPQLFVVGWRGSPLLLLPTELGLALLDGSMEVHHVPLDPETVAKLASFDGIEIIDPHATDRGTATRATWLLRPGERRNTVFH